jgi:hypothetical protein
MSDQNKSIRQFEPIACPHCKKEFFIGLQYSVPAIVSTPTMDDVNEAKKQIMERLDEITFSDDSEKQQIIKYLKNEETIIDFSDIEHMLKQIAMDQVEKQTKNESNKSKA